MKKRFYKKKYSRMKINKNNLQVNYNNYKP